MLLVIFTEARKLTKEYVYSANLEVYNVVRIIKLQYRTSLDNLIYPKMAKMRRRNDQ